MNDQIPNDSQVLQAETFRIVGDAPPLFAALAQAQAAFGPITKNRTVTVYPKEKNGYKPPPYTFDYATFDTILDACRPALNANGFALVQPFSAVEERCELRTMLVHSSGAYLELVYVFFKPESIQALGSAITYARRYSVASLLGVSSEEDDDGNAADGNQREARPRGNPPAAPAKTQNRPQERSQAAKAKPEPEKTNGAPEAKREPAPSQTEPMPQAALDMNERPEVVNDINGPDGEAVDEDRPEFRDPNPMTEATKTLVTQTMTKLLSANGTGRDIPLPLRAAIVKHASGVEMVKGVQFTEGEGQRIVAFLYEVANGIKLDPDGHLSGPEVKAAIKAFEKRVGIVS